MLNPSLGTDRQQRDAAARHMLRAVQVEAKRLTVLQTKGLSYGDAGLALGQAWVAARTVASGASVFGI